MKIHHVALAVKNLDQSVQWYQNMFGFEKDFSYDKNGMKFVMICKDDVKLELFQFENMTELPDYSKEVMTDLHVIGTKHIAFQTDNLQEKVEELKQKGVQFVTEIDTAAAGGKYIFLKDCDGILIELYQN